MAMAGPGVSFLIGLILIIFSFFKPAGESFVDYLFLSRINDPYLRLVWMIAMLNIALGIFNLLPAFPMDGGRVLRAWLAEEWSHENPMDIVGDAQVYRYARVFDLMIRHQDIWDIAFVVAVPSGILEPRHLAQDIVRFWNHNEKMIVGCLLGGDSMKSGVRVLRDASILNPKKLSMLSGKRSA